MLGAGFRFVPRWLWAVLWFYAASGMADDEPTAAVAGLDAQLTSFGQGLFFDTRLSVTNDYSCASCHDPKRAFTDGRALAIGATGQTHTRNTPTLLNVAQRPSFGWTKDKVLELSEQHKIPLTNTTPIELGFGPRQLSQLIAAADFRAHFAKAFEPPSTPSMDTIATALAAYVTSLTYRSAFDEYLQEDNASGLSPSAQRGLTLFTSAQLGCSSCHFGPGLGGGQRSIPTNRGHSGALPAVFFKRTVAVGDALEKLNIRVPSLQAVGQTAPYMIDGRLPDLQSVVEFYVNGGAPEIKSFTLSAPQRADLIEFLNHL